MNNTESLIAASFGTATIAKNAGADEDAHATGHYQFRILSPYEHLRSYYIALSDYIQSLHDQANGSWIDRIKLRFHLGFKRMDDVIAEIQERMAAMVYVKEEFGFDNLVTTVGKNFALDTFLSGSGFTAAWYLGLVDDSPTFNAADTMASHAGWTENTAYSEGARPTAAFSSASSGSKAFSSALSFSINATSQVIAGCFLTTVATKGGTTGTLYSAGAFTGGDKSVTTGDTLQVSYTASL